ncbi:hypothetical protein CHARACLAT_007539 [Characodon lateralis]|uniref:Uncharacterized protein n=1 Tax=Characodon lateralis TaxID=208331 RepID=A0ABU7F3B8_9TELE|nr:hypothetical protein [Characodon lateralis]
MDINFSYPTTMLVRGDGVLGVQMKAMSLWPNNLVVLSSDQRAENQKFFFTQMRFCKGLAIIFSSMHPPSDCLVRAIARDMAHNLQDGHKVDPCNLKVVGSIS